MLFNTYYRPYIYWNYLIFDEKFSSNVSMVNNLVGRYIVTTKCDIIPNYM